MCPGQFRGAASLKCPFRRPGSTRPPAETPIAFCRWPRSHNNTVSPVCGVCPAARPTINCEHTFNGLRNGIRAMANVRAFGKDERETKREKTLNIVYLRASLKWTGSIERANVRSPLLGRTVSISLARCGRSPFGCKGINQSVVVRRAVVVAAA